MTTNDNRDTRDELDARGWTLSRDIARRARLFVYPIREMIKRGWLVDGDVDSLERQMCRFFEVDSVNDIPLIDGDREVKP